MTTDFMYYISKRFAPIVLLFLMAVYGLAQSGNSGAIKTTNAPFAGAVLFSDGSKYYWAFPEGPTNGVSSSTVTSIVNSAISSGNLGTITNADTHSFLVESKILLSKASHPSSDGYEFWDDFNRTVTNSPGISPSGHTWGFSSASGVNSNVVFVQDGAFKIATNAPAGATYWGITNSNPSTTWNKFKGSLLYREYDANGFEQGLGFILANNYFRGGTNWLHVGINFSGFYVQRELAAFLINEQYPSALEPDIEHTYEIMLSGDKLWARVAKHYYFVQNDAITNYTSFPVVIYEHNMKMTNRPAQYFGEWLSAAAGQFESPFVNMAKPFDYSSNSTAISAIRFADGSTQSKSASNSIVVAAGTGGITVDAVSSGGVTTFTVNDDDAGGSGGSSNMSAAAIGYLTSTNLVFNSVTNLGTNAVQVWDASSKRFARSGVYGNTTLVFTNQAAVTNLAGGQFKVDYEAEVYVLQSGFTITLAGLHPITSGNLFWAAGVTNYLSIRWNGTNWSANTSHSATTGSGAYALSNAPVISGATLLSQTILGTDGSIRFDEHSSAPSTPSSGNVALYAKADGLLYSKDDAGTETLVSGGVGGGSGGGFILTNLFLLGSTNATLSSGYWPSFDQTTNANYTLNFNHSFALPAGYRVTTIHTNSAATNYTVTLNTNTVAANFIDPYGKTNANSFSVTFGGKSVAEWMWTGNGWILLSLNGPTPVLKFGSGITAVTNGVNGLDVTISASGGGGSTTNAIPVTLAINGGTGSTNIVIDFWQLAQMSTNSVRVTLTANAGVIVTNIVDGKELVIDVVQDSTGNRTIAQSAVGGAPLRFGTDITGFGLSTNGTYIDHVKLRGVGTNAHVVGMIRGYAP